jgi:Leucine-rich repeat (LRR) protein
MIFQLTVPGFLAILIVTAPGASSWDCPSPCRCYEEAADCSHKNQSRIDENMFDRTGAERLAVLNLENNQLTSLPDHIFDPLWGLKSLNLNHNLLQVLGVSLFSKLKDLEFLDMKGNQLSSLPVGLFAFQKELVSLDLSDNLLSTLDIGVVTPLMNLNTLLIGGNRLVCDCRLKPVATWNNGKLNRTDAECHSPPQHNGHSWYMVTSIECPSPLSTPTIPPSIDMTPGPEIQQSTPVTRTRTEAPPARPSIRLGDVNVYAISIVLIAVLIILTLVVIGTMVFIYCYKRLRGGSTHVQDCDEE